MGTRRHLRVSGVAVILAGMVASGAAFGEDRVPSPAAERPAFPASPFHGVLDGNGHTIPCRCRFQGLLYQLGDLVCMSTPEGTVLTRCDLLLNNTSWVPTHTPCTLSRFGVRQTASLLP